jgi:ATP-dependent Clp protease ATP-binding subunit ClpB
VRRQPYAVVLLDEVEKAHPDVFNILLQVLDDGRLSDSQGRTVSFKNTIIVMTSNIGSQRIAQAEQPASVEDLMPDIRKFFRIEFVNRIDEILVFQPLGEEELIRIAGLRFRDLAARLRDRGIEAEITGEASRAIAVNSFDPQYGARPINRYIQTQLENPLSRMIVAGTLVSKDRLTVDYVDGAFAFLSETGTERGVAEAGDRKMESESEGRGDVDDVAFIEV